MFALSYLKFTSLRNNPICQLELFLSEVNNRETIAAIEANNDTYCLEKWIEKFPL